MMTCDSHVKKKGAPHEYSRVWHDVVSRGMHLSVQEDVMRKHTDDFFPFPIGP